MKTLEEIVDIRALINEIYEDCDEERAKSRDCFRNYCDHIKKELKALEIIKKKEVNVGVLIHHITDKYLLGLESYNFMWGGTPECQLTQEEYDLLKEVLL